jgi:hypothetical protein
MEVQRGAGGARGVINRGGVCRSVWARWGLWRGSGWSRRTVGRVRGSYWIPWSAGSRGVRLQHHFLIVGKAFVDLSSLLSLQTLRDKREGLLQYNSTRGW